MPAITNFQQANQALSELYQNFSTGPYKLDTIRTLLAYLRNPQQKLKIVHVAGTSGKTSTAYFVAALLQAGGALVGLTVSPHVDQVNERVQFNLEPLPEAEFCEALTEFLDLVTASGTKPSYFECLVAFAYWSFDRRGVDYAVVEVGLGGLLDGTNVADRPDKVCVITDIGFDHVAILGNTLAEIAAQKAGIIYKHNSVITYQQAPEVDAAIDQQVAQKQANLQRLDETTEANLYGQDFPVTMPDYQRRNWLLAYVVYRDIQQRDDLDPVTMSKLASTQAIQVPGRMDIRQVGDKTLIMDGAHNAQKFGTFLSSFRKLYPNTEPAVLIALKQDKEPIDIIPGISELATRVIITKFQANQDLPATSIDSQQMVKMFVEAGVADVQAVDDLHEAYQVLLSGPEIVCIITGSFYLLSQLRMQEHLA